MSEEVHSDLDPFRYMVRRFIAIDSPNLIENSSPAHARILLEEMFANAKTSAYVYCGRISNTVWGGKARRGGQSLAPHYRRDNRLLVPDYGFDIEIPRSF